MVYRSLRSVNKTKDLESLGGKVLKRELKIGKKIIFAGILLVVLSAILFTASAMTRDPIYASINTILFLAFALYHGAKRYGWKTMLLFTGLVTVVSWSYETLSILTGFPFGHYNYTQNFIGPWVGLVPALIIPAYLAMGYLSWTVASILLDKKDSSVKGSEVLLLPLLSSFVMVMWDLTMDPLGSTIGQFWSWHNGGAYFGVPFVNFMGWFLCVFTFYLLFAIYLKSNKNPNPNILIKNKAFWVLPVLMYVGRTILNFFAVVLEESVQIVSNEGHVWWTGDIFQSLLLVSIFTMGFVAFYSIVRISRS